MRQHWIVIFSKERKGKTSKPEDEVCSVSNQFITFAEEKTENNEEKTTGLHFNARFSERKIFPSGLRNQGI